MRISPLVRTIPLALVSFALCAAQSDLNPDFKNFTYPWRGNHGVPSKWKWLQPPASGSVRLVNGEYKFASDGEHNNLPPSVRFVSDSRGDIGDTSHKAAAVTLGYSTGGTANWSYLYVYDLAGGRLRLLGMLESGSRADGGLIKATIKDGLLLIDFADTGRRTADCCSAGFVQVRYRWDGTRFSQMGSVKRGNIADLEN